MHRVAQLLTAAALAAAGCGRRQNAPAYTSTAHDASLGACLTAAARVVGNSAQREAVARCAALAPVQPAGVRVIGVIPDRPRPDTGRH